MRVPRKKKKAIKKQFIKSSGGEGIIHFSKNSKLFIVVPKWYHKAWLIQYNEDLKRIME